MYSRGNGRLMINNNDDGDDVSSFSGSLFSFPIWFPIKMKVLLKEYLDSRCALIYPIVSSLDSRLELFKLFLRIGSILFSVSIQFGKRKRKQKFFTSEKVDALAEETISLLSFASFEFIDWFEIHSITVPNSRLWQFDRWRSRNLLRRCQFFFFLLQTSTLSPSI